MCLKNNISAKYKRLNLSVIAIITLWSQLLILTGCSSGGATNSQTSNPGLPTITLKAIDSNNLPALNHMSVASYNGYWLILGGKTAGFHAFTYASANKIIYVYNPLTKQVYSENIESTDLPTAIKEQLTSLAPEYLQDQATLYLAGGYYNNPIESNIYKTLQIISSYNLPGIITAIINGDHNLRKFTHYDTSLPIFKVTGGNLGKINDYFYQAFGQECIGYYCETLQVYTNTIYKFKMTPDLSTISIESSIYNTEINNSGFRRRDYVLSPLQIGAVETLVALGGPFTPGNFAYVWTNGILFDQNLKYSNSFFNQQANQYKDAALSMYSQKNNTSYIATFAGFSNLYWSAESGLVYDNTTPFGNILDLLVYNNQQRVSEYANITPLCSGQPLSSCLYMGADAVFIPSSVNFDHRHILLLDNITQQTLVGYIYGGLISTQQSVFNGGSDATNQAYAVYLTPNTSAESWLEITGLESGTPYIPNSNL